MVRAGDMMNREDILEILAIPLIGVVPDHEEIIISANRGTPVAYDDDSIVGEAYRRVGRRIAGEPEVPYVAMEPSGIWASVKRWMGLAPAISGAV